MTPPETSATAGEYMFIPDVTQICCHVNSRPIAPDAQQPGLAGEMRAQTSLLLAYAHQQRLEFRGSAGWRAELMIGVTHYQD